MWFYRKDFFNADYVIVYLSKKCQDNTDACLVLQAIQSVCTPGHSKCLWCFIGCMPLRRFLKHYLPYCLTSGFACRTSGNVEIFYVWFLFFNHKMTYILVEKNRGMFKNVIGNMHIFLCGLNWNVKKLDISLHFKGFKKRGCDL